MYLMLNEANHSTAIWNGSMGLEVNGDLLRGKSFQSPTLKITLEYAASAKLKLHVIYTTCNNVYTQCCVCESVWMCRLGNSAFVSVW